MAQQACHGSERLPARATAPCSCSRRAPTASWGAFNTRLPLRLAPALGQRRGQSVQLLSAAAVEESAPAREFPSMGPDVWNTTYYPKGADADPNTKAWYLIDAEGQTLGRLACLAANHIRGKLVPGYQPSMDMGSYVVVVNAEKVAVTGDKSNQKMYRRHTGRPGSMKEETFRHLQARLPERIVEQAIKGMLPSGRLGKRLFTHLKVYKGPAHPHQAQRPTDITAHINQKPIALVSSSPS